MDDARIWVYDKNGVYTVKSAYKRLRERAEVLVPVLSSMFWRKFWRLKLSPKVKNLVWRACSGSVPIKQALFYRRVDVDLSCPVSPSAIESDSHVFLFFPLA